MTIIRPNSITGINSITAQSSELNFYDSSGSSLVSIGNTVFVNNLSVNGNSYPTDGPLSNRNLIINGAMQVWQRGTTFAGLTDGDSIYTSDRWSWSEGGTPSAVVTVSQESDVPSGLGFAYSLKVSPTTADPSINSNEIQVFYHAIEAQNLQQLGYGTANAKVSTLSFWVKCSQSGIANVWLYRDDSVRSCTLQYTINQTDTWQKIILTVPADTTGTIPNDNGSGMSIYFNYAAGSDFTGTGGNDGVWGASTSTGRANGQTVQCLNATSDYFQITGVQFEIGTVATPFEHRIYADELVRCQRYALYVNTKFTGGGFVPGGSSQSGASDYRSFVLTYQPVQMRPGTCDVGDLTQITQSTDNSAAILQRWNVDSATSYDNGHVQFRTLDYAPNSSANATLMDTWEVPFYVANSSFILSNEL